MMPDRDGGLLSAIRYGRYKEKLMPLVAGDFELGIDMREVDWPGELFIVSGPDPVILVADDVLMHMFWQPEDIHPDVTLERAASGHGSTGHAVGDYECYGRAGHVCFHNSMLRFRCREQTVVYRIGDYEPARNAWWAAWPD
jgi:hypothetical protein